MNHTHVVFFWLTEGSDQVAFTADVKRLIASSGALHGWAGAPVGTGREVADDSFQVGATLIFASRADHDAYQVAAAHDQFVAKWKPYWQRVHEWPGCMYRECNVKKCRSLSSGKAFF